MEPQERRLTPKIKKQRSAITRSLSQRTRDHVRRYGMDTPMVFDSTELGHTLRVFSVPFDQAALEQRDQYELHPSTFADANAPAVLERRLDRLLRYELFVPH